MAEVILKEDVKWANPGALGLAGFGLNTILLQIHNLGLISGTVPLIYGFFWGGTVQVIAGLIDGRRGDSFGMTAFTSYGFFWIGLSFILLLQWLGVVKPDNPGLAWAFICWGIFTAYMTIGTFKISRVHVVIFASLTLLFFLLAATFFGALSSVVPGVAGIFTGATAAYGSAAVIVHEKFGRWIFPIGLLS